MLWARPCLPLEWEVPTRHRSRRDEGYDHKRESFLQHLSILNPHVFAHHFEALLLVSLVIADSFDQALHEINQHGPINLRKDLLVTTIALVYGILRQPKPNFHLQRPEG